MSVDPPAVERATEAHRARWGEPAFIARAPGRVNLIGEHTDYNDGFVLPMALPFDTVLAVSEAAAGEPSEIHSEGFGRAVLGVDTERLRTDDWAVHVRGVVRLLGESGVVAPPWRASIATDVPIDASLSSSAAIEVAAVHAILRLAGSEWSSRQIAWLCQRVENEVLGLPTGIMDQLISASAVEGHASLIDCRSLAIEPQPLPGGAVVAVMDTRTRRQLVDSAFAARRETCARAAEMLDVASLRDASLDDLDRLPEDAVLERHRARHVIAENRRTLEAAAAMRADDPHALGTLMNASHVSLRDDYEVSGEALDSIVAAAQVAPGCHGARMTGGGFAGCAVALVSTDRVDAFTAAVERDYLAAQGLDPVIWVCAPGAGASIEPPRL